MTVKFEGTRKFATLLNVDETDRWFAVVVLIYVIHVIL